MMRAAIHTMFSDKEKQTAKSIEDQVALCRAFCKREGHIVVELLRSRHFRPLDHQPHGLSAPDAECQEPEVRCDRFEVSRPHLTRPQRPGRLSQRTRSAGVQLIAAQDNIDRSVCSTSMGLIGNSGT